MVQQLHNTSLHSANPSTKEGGDGVGVCIMRIPWIMAQKGVPRPRQTPVLFFTRARIYIGIGIGSQDTPISTTSTTSPHLLYIGPRRDELSRRQRRSAAGKEACRRQRERRRQRGCAAKKEKERGEAEHRSLSSFFLYMV